MWPGRRWYLCFSHARSALLSACCSGGSSDWERLVSLTGGASEVLDLYVSAEAWAVTDLSLQQNELKPISMYMPLRQSRTGSAWQQQQA